MNRATSFWQDTVTYACQIKQFSRTDWNVYFAWVGLMLGLLFSVFGFILVGYFHGADFPPYVWNVPLGTIIFVGAIAFDTIGHRTAYKEELKKGEELVHHITIFAGITSVLALCLCYTWPSFFRIPAISLIALSILYSIIDEALHWHRYLNKHSDRVEMWSHFFIFLGHTIMVLSWYYWFDQGYPGVATTVEAMKQMGIFF
ncbi:MAG: hypothetical protein SGJ18_00435 [Pseudomonadota bacterium]|nr:hypothetical protein [Pseudomonadota bacterium]